MANNYQITSDKVVSTVMNMLKGKYGPIHYRRDNSARNYSWIYNIMTWYKNHWCSDCLGFVHSVVNGFRGDKTVEGGGALRDIYLTSTNELETLRQSDHTPDFSKKLLPAELLYMPGHVGFYLGKFTMNGKTYNAAENTLSWDKGLQPSYVDSKGRRFQYKGSVQNGRWTEHGKINRVKYVEPAPVKEDTFMTVLEFEAWCNAAGYKTQEGKELLLDGDFGPACEWVANNRVGVSYKKGLKQAVKLVQAIVGAKTDGDPGEKTVNAIKAWQAKNGLLVDGIFKVNCWKKALGLM